MTDGNTDGAHATEGIAGVAPDSPLAAVLGGREEIMALTQASHDAVLHPRDPGGLSHTLRAALACRMARMLRDSAAEAHYRGLLTDAEGGAALDALTVPGATSADRRTAAILCHADLLTRAPRQATRADIAALRDAGVAEADIVRLSELAAFVNYQLRLAAGLRMLQGARG